MGKYSLLAIDRINNSEKTISLYNEKKNKNVSKFNLSEIDFFTSSFSSEFAFTNYLREQGIEIFNNVRYCIVTTYNDKDYYFKVIFNSELINKVAENVNAGYIIGDENYSTVINSFYSNIDSKIFQESIENTNYIKSNLKQKILRYVEISNKEKNHADEYEEQNRLYFEINEELKRYKIFRGLYLFLGKYKKYGYVEKSDYSSNKENNIIQNCNNVQNNNVVGNYTEQIDYIDSVEGFNEEFDEFLTDDDFRSAYGEGNATQYVKGARYD